MHFVDQAPACGVKFNVGIGTELVLFPDPAQLPVASDKKLSEARNETSIVAMVRVH